MNCCYDYRRPLQTVSLRTVIAALLVLLSSTASGQAVDERKPWHSEVVPANPRLPSVAIDLGYPGPYLPPLNAPMTVHATASAASFDGYIGFHYAVRDRLTLDTPVIARALLGPHTSWSFHTMTGLQRCCPGNEASPREVVVEWRDRSMRMIASRSAGVPPWATWSQGLKPLRVIASADERVPRMVLGAAPYVARAQALSDRAQWYAGFSSVVLPLSTWLDLRQPVREAIFASGVLVALFGFPRPGQHHGQLDQVLLPVSFNAKPGSCEAPWPYRGSRSMPVATPLSATAKKGSDTIGSSQNPYVARTWAAVWACEEEAFGAPLPAMSRFANGHYRAFGDTSSLESSDRSEDPRRDPGRDVARASFLSAHSSAVAATIAALITIAGWLLLRKTPRFGVAVAIVVAASLLVAARSRIRPVSEVREYIIRSPVATGITDRIHIWRSYGPAPLAAIPANPHDAVTGDSGQREEAELRTSETPPSLGLLNHRGDWDAATRWSVRRELDDSSTGTRISNRSIDDFHQDFHSAVVLWFADKPASGPYRLESRLTNMPNGDVTLAFALPASGNHKTTATVHFPHWYAGHEVEITWATGSMTGRLARNDAEVNSSVAIPEDVCRSVAEQGGIARITVANPHARLTDTAWLEVRE